MGAKARAGIHRSGTWKGLWKDEANEAGKKRGDDGVELGYQVQTKERQEKIRLKFEVA